MPFTTSGAQPLFDPEALLSTAMNDLTTLLGPSIPSLRQPSLFQSNYMWASRSRFIVLSISALPNHPA